MSLKITQFDLESLKRNNEHFNFHNYLFLSALQPLSIR